MIRETDRKTFEPPGPQVGGVLMRSFWIQGGLVATLCRTGNPLRVAGSAWVPCRKHLFGIAATPGYWFSDARVTSGSVPRFSV